MNSKQSIKIYSRYVIAFIIGCLFIYLLNSRTNLQGIYQPIGWKQLSVAGPCGPSNPADPDSGLVGCNTCPPQVYGFPLQFEKDESCGSEFSKFAEIANYLIGGLILTGVYTIIQKNRKHS